MTKQEFGIIMMAITANWDDMQLNDVQMEFWYSCLKDLDYKILALATKKLVMENKFKPKISDIREKYVEIIRHKDYEISSDEAWGEVIKAIKHYGRYKKDEAFETMSKPTRSLVERLGWDNLCNSENQMADRAHFLRLFDTNRDNQKRLEVLPNEMKEQIALLKDKFSIENNITVNKYDLITDKKEYINEYEEDYNDEV